MNGGVCKGISRNCHDDCTWSHLRWKMSKLGGLSTKNVAMAGTVGWMCSMPMAGKHPASLRQAVRCVS
jgi:hypothetical protein